MKRYKLSSLYAHVNPPNVGVVCRLIHIVGLKGCPGNSYLILCDVTVGECRLRPRHVNIEQHARELEFVENNVFGHYRFGCLGKCTEEAVDRLGDVSPEEIVILHCLNLCTWSKRQPLGQRSKWLHEKIQ